MKIRKFESEKYKMTARNDSLTDGILYYSCYCKGKGDNTSHIRIQLLRIFKFTIELE